MKRLFALIASALLVCALALSSAQADGGSQQPGLQPTPTPCQTKEECPDGSGSPVTTTEESEPEPATSVAHDLLSLLLSIF